MKLNLEIFIYMRVYFKWKLGPRLWSKWVTLKLNRNKDFQDKQKVKAWFYTKLWTVLLHIYINGIWHSSCRRTFDSLHLSLNTLSSFEFETVLVMFRCPTFTIINVTLLIVEHLKTWDNNYSTIQASKSDISNMWYR